MVNDLYLNEEALLGAELVLLSLPSKNKIRMKFSVCLEECLLKVILT